MQRCRLGRPCECRFVTGSAGPITFGHGLGSDGTLHGFVPSAIHATFDPIALGAGLFGAILLVQVVTIGLVIHMDCFQLRGLSKTRCTG